MSCLLRSFLRVFVFALGALSALTGETAAPGRVQVRSVGQLPPVNSMLNRDEVPLARKLALAMATSGSTESSEAGEVLAASIDEVNSFLATKVSRPSNASILVDRGKDILVAQWPLNPPMEGVVPILLWDDSISETIVFRCGATRISTAPSVEQLVDGLMNWNNRRLGSAGLSVRRPAVPGTVLVGYGYRGADAIPSQFAVGVEVTFSGFISGKAGYLGVSFVSHSGAFPTGMKGIDERFPPLLERVPHWATARLIAEIGHSSRAKSSFEGRGAREWGRLPPRMATPPGMRRGLPRAVLKACHEITVAFERGAGGARRVHTIVNAARERACATTSRHSLSSIA
jgi:hypothetical protein